MPRFSTFLAISTLISLYFVGSIGCKSSDDGTSANMEKSQRSFVEIKKTALKPRSTSTASTMFTQLTSQQTGIGFVNEIKPEHIVKYVLNGEGICTGDYDNDGLVDLFAVSKDGSNKLYRQVAPWEFVDVTESAGNLGGNDTWGTGASFADINNDGLLDLYVCNYGATNQLFVNNGDGTFDEQARARNLDYTGATTMAAFADYDNDGDLDLYLVNNRVYTLGDKVTELKIITENGNRTVHPDFRQEAYFLEGRLQEAGEHDVLYRNDDGKFTNVTKAAGIVGYDMGLSATWFDYDRDNFIDLYVGNDGKSPDHLYKNLGNGSFKDVLPEAVGHTAWFSMGADAADLNNDGLLDIVSADMSSTTHYKQKTTMGDMSNESWFLTMGRPRQFMRNSVYLNSGTQRFWEMANMTGLDSTDWTWSVKANDYDCDGLVDIFFTNGVGRNMNHSDYRREFDRLMAEGRKEEARNQILKMPPLNEKNLFFRNLGNLKFENSADAWGADELGVSQGCSVADIDRDGDLDLFVSNMNKPLGIYRNDCPTGNRILVKLNGTKSNRFGINAMVSLECDGKKMIRQMLLSRGYMSADEPMIQFGLGKATKIDKLTIEWPSGIVQTIADLDVNYLYTVTENGPPQKKHDRGLASTPTQFLDVTDTSGIEFSHIESYFDDFRFQPLLPNQMSRLGPGIAWGDVDADGEFDCYVCGAMGQVGSLFTKSKDGKFAARSGPWRSRLLTEELGALFLDFDSDGDQDLYVVSGGYEEKEGSEFFRDHLYVNDGTGNFSDAPDDVLPDIRRSGSSVSAADFDRDGDLDLLIGTRMISRQWPLPASSTLLRNDDGKFIDVSGTVAPALKDIGLVTSSIWSDADNDGWVDLLLTLEWGHVKFLKNENGELVDRTSESGLGDDLGWWNSIAAGDVDNDGDMDYVAMNAGLNTKYHANKKHPVTLYAHDFDDNGRIDLVESEWEGERCFPIRGKSCSSHAMPAINEQFPTYHEFAMAEVGDIYGDESLSEAAKFEVNNLSSVVLINDGNANFNIVELPKLAQVSPGFGIVIEDLDADGNTDIFIAQNFLHPQPETGQMDGGMGLMMRGDGKGNFKPIGPRQSGIIVPEQGMGLTVNDLNQDNLPDLVMTINDGPVRVFENRGRPPGRKLYSMFLDAGNGNRAAAGTRIELVSSNGEKIVREIHSGNGYLSQSPGTIFFSCGSKDAIQKAIIRWPNGSSDTVDLEPDKYSIRVTQTAEVSTDR